MPDVQRCAVLPRLPPGCRAVLDELPALGASRAMRYLERLRRGLEREAGAVGAGVLYSLAGGCGQGPGRGCSVAWCGAGFWAV